MPHINPSGSDDLATHDEVKVYKEEGEGDEEQRSENLSEVKLGLVTETEEKSKGPNVKEEVDSKNGGIIRPFPERAGELPYPHPYYLMPPYLHERSALMGELRAAHTASLMRPISLDPLGSPPPAHMGLGRSMYSLSSPHSQLSAAFYPPELSQWAGSSYHSLSPGFRNPYSSALPGSPLSRFSPIPGTGGLPPGVSHPALVTAGPRHDFPLNLDSHSSAFSRSRSAFSGGPFHNVGSPLDKHEPPERKRPHIKKPLNAFMLFMKEMRAKVVAECTLKESAAINQILGRKWHALDRSEQAKYYDMARKEKELHMQLYPGWSARDNYAIISKRKKRRKIEPSERPNGDCNLPKKCRARFGVDQQDQWCKHCKRKKKCLRFMGNEGESEDDHSAASQASTLSPRLPSPGLRSALSPRLSSPGLRSPITSVSSPLLHRPETPETPVQLHSPHSTTTPHSSREINRDKRDVDDVGKLKLINTRHNEADSCATSKHLSREGPLVPEGNRPLPKLDRCAESAEQPSSSTTLLVS